MKKKILVIRFSSIGDIVLTSPVLRCLHRQEYEIHFLVKEKFYPVIKNYPYVQHVHRVHQHPAEILDTLTHENFDFVADLQNNWKSKWLCRKLKRPYRTFPKLNVLKWLVVWTKQKWLLPNIHIVDRYFKAIQPLNVFNDNKGLDFFIDEKNINNFIKDLSLQHYIILVPGGSYYTKQIPVSKIEEILRQHPDKKFIAIGDNADREKIHPLTKQYSHLQNLCGKTNLDESAYLIQHSQCVITSDTGMMHIAAAFKKKILSLWGNTIPEFGMYPYMPGKGSKIIENKKLWCRPCSKLGYSYCPLLHFKCMNDLKINKEYL